MASSPMISVIMGVYNNGPFLREAIESILNQSYRDFEFIIIDDGSTDASPLILKEYANQDGRIRLVRQENAGLTKSLNTALRLAHGQYIARMDGDDVAFPDRFEFQLSFMESHPDCICSGTNVLIIDDTGDPIFYSQQPLSNHQIEKQLFIGRGSAIYHPTAIIRRDGIQKVGGYKDKYRIGQDLDLFLRLSDIGQLLNLNRVTLKFRKHYSSTTTFAEGKESINRRKKIVLEAGQRKEKAVNLKKIERKWGPNNKWEFHASLMEKALKHGNKIAATKHLRKAIRVAPLNRQNIRLLFYYKNFSVSPLDGEIQRLYASFDYLEAYSRHTDIRVDQDPKMAVGGKWEILGRLQFEFLKKRGLQPEHTLLDLGCGTLRGGRHFIRYLDPGNYTGIDISWKAIQYARELVDQEGLLGKMPNLLLNKYKSLDFKQCSHTTFDYILAQSVFTHLKPEHIQECFLNIRKVMHENSTFYFTYFKGQQYQEASQKDFFYPLSYFEELAEKYHYILEDHTWDYLHPTGQNMLALKENSRIKNSSESHY